MIAALGMYDRAELRSQTDAYWGAIRDGLRTRGIAAPDTLTRDDRAYWAGWTDPDLLLSQTCGLPFRARLHDKVALVGTPDFAVPGCPPGHYRSMLVARADDPRDLTALAEARFALNEDLSQSGWGAPWAHMTGLGLPIRPALRTGGHVLSARAVAEGAADWGALDAVTWALIESHDPALAGRLRVVDATAPTPGLPYITALTRDPEPIRAAVAEAIAALPAETRAALRLQGIVAIPVAAYLAQPLPPAPELPGH